MKHQIEQTVTRAALCTGGRVKRKFLSVGAMFVVACAITARSGEGFEPTPRATKHLKTEGASVHALFDLASPSTSPFPSDRFTLPDADQNTGRRVNLPKPVDCVANASDCEEIDDLNELDGFSAAPWLSIPFDGDIDPNTIVGNVFLIALGDTLAPQPEDADAETHADHDNAPSVGNSGFHKISLNQIIWDQQA